jgi:hypothetical protein
MLIPNNLNLQKKNDALKERHHILDQILTNEYTYFVVTNQYIYYISKET